MHKQLMFANLTTFAMNFAITFAIIASRIPHMYCITNHEYAISILMLSVICILVVKTRGTF